MDNDLYRKLRTLTGCGASAALSECERHEHRLRLESFLADLLNDNVTISTSWYLSVNVVMEPGVDWKPVYRRLRERLGAPSVALKIGNGDITARFKSPKVCEDAYDQDVQFTVAFPHCKVIVLQEAVTAKYSLDCGVDDLEQQVLNEAELPDLLVDGQPVRPPSEENFDDTL